MKDWFSHRFGLRVVLTHHAKERMEHRKISEQEVRDLVEEGDIREKEDPRHLWIFQAFPGRGDNLICAAVAKENVLVIKTLMTHWQEDEG